MTPTELVAKWRAEADSLRAPDKIRLCQHTRADILRECADALEATSAEGMPVSLVFHDWLDRYHESVYYTATGVEELANGDFHHGSTFQARIEVLAENAEHLKQAMEAGYRPVFYVVPAPDPTNGTPQTQIEPQTQEAGE